MHHPGLLANLDLSFLADQPCGIYLVGGTVRDLIAGRPPADIDLVVTGDMAPIANRIAQKIGGKVIDLGKKAFAVKRIVAGDTTIDIAPCAQGTIEADLRQRDFTINAMAYDLEARRLVDCTGGRADMRRKKIRMVSSAALANDPARLVRAYRLAAAFHFSIDTDTSDAIGIHRHLVAGVAGERIWAELQKLFEIADSAHVVMGMAESGLLPAIFPELQPTIGCTQNRHHRFDVFDHSLRAYAKLERLLDQSQSHAPPIETIIHNHEVADQAAIMKYAALLHDVGKPATRKVDGNGKVRFPGHAGKGADITLGISRRLRLSNRHRNIADALIRHHIRPLFLYLAAENKTLGRRGMVRFFNHCGPSTLPIILHAMADIMAKGGLLQPRDSGFIAFCHRLIEAYLDANRRQASEPPIINGHDLITRFDLAPSPRFKRILQYVDERRLCGELTTRDQALAWVDTYLASQREDDPT